MKFDDVTRQSLLYDFYGELLTQRQKEVMELYNEENLSLAEIAEEFGISRQGVHDALHKAQKALEEYERKLGYSNGWNTGFYFSACYAAVALALAEFNHAGEAAAFIDRLEELRYEEITAQDIVDRAGNEAGVDVSGMVRKAT